MNGFKKCVEDILGNKVYAGHVDRYTKYAWEAFNLVADPALQHVASLAENHIGEKAPDSDLFVRAGEINGVVYWAKTEKDAEKWRGFHDEAKAIIHRAVSSCL